MTNYNNNVNLTPKQYDERNLRIALSLIKEHITERETAQNADLSEAINLIVNAARSNGLLEDANESVAFYNEWAAGLRNSWVAK